VIAECSHRRDLPTVASAAAAARMVDEPAADDNVKAVHIEQAQQPGEVPLVAGELEIAHRLAWLKRQTSSSPPRNCDRPTPR
jgi:hypothetical protein